MSARQKKSKAGSGVKPAKPARNKQVSGSVPRESVQTRAETDQFHQMAGAESPYFKKA